MAVIAVLVAVAIPTFGSQLEKARQATDMANLRDAYATAKMEILNVEDSTSVLAARRDTSLTEPMYYRYWYKDEALVYIGGTADVTAASANTLMGKATTSTVLNSGALPTYVTYVNKTLADSDATETADIAGATAKGIVVEFLYNPSTNTFALSNVTFVNKTKGSDTAKLLTGSGAARTVTSITLTDPDNKAYSATSNKLTLAGLVVNATYDDGETEAIAYSNTTKPHFTIKAKLGEATTFTDIAEGDEITAAGKIQITYGGQDATFDVTYSA